MPTANVERQANPVVNLEPLDGIADRHDLAEVFMAEYPTGLHVGSSLVHVEVGTTNIGGPDFNDHIGGTFDGRVRHVFYSDVPRPAIYNCFHSSLLLNRVAAQCLALQNKAGKKYMA
jgi:hypothetical protein